MSTKITFWIMDIQHSTCTIVHHVCID